MANCRNTQQLNITCGTDVVLHDKLMFDSEVFDPNVSVDIECNLVNSLGKRTSLEYEIADEVLIIQIPWVDGRNAGCYGLEVKGKCNGKTWATYADSLIRYTRATVKGAAVVETEHDWYDVTQVVSYRYSDSPLDEVDATIDDNYGEPTVTTTYEHNKLTLGFKNLRGNGIANVEQTTVSTEDEGVNEATITQDNGNTTVIQVKNGSKGSKGDKGDTGDSAIFDPTTGNISEMKQGTGDDALSPMSQKAVTELVETEVVTTLTLEKGEVGKYLKGDGSTGSNGSIAYSDYYELPSLTNKQKMVFADLFIHTTSTPPAKSIYFYTADKTLLLDSSINVSGSYTLLPENIPFTAKYIRVNFYRANYADWQYKINLVTRVERLDVIEEILSNRKLYSTTGQNTDGSMTQKATTDLVSTLANKTDKNYTVGYDASGNANANAYLPNDLIPVTAGWAVRCYGVLIGVNARFYKGDGTLVAKSTSGGSNNTWSIIVPDGCISLKITFALSKKSEAEVWCNNELVWKPVESKDLSDVDNVVISHQVDIDNDLVEVPEHYKSYIQNRAATVWNKDVKYKGNGDSFIFLTDYHLPDDGMLPQTQSQFRHSGCLVRYLQKHTETKRFVFGGDIQCSASDDVQKRIRYRQFIEDFRDTNFLPVIGNHEWRNGSQNGNDKQAKIKLDFGSFMSNLKGVTFDQYKMPYYYFDNPVMKIRYFVVYAPETVGTDAYGIYFDSRQWPFIEAKAFEVGSSWNIVVFQHIVGTSVYTVFDENGEPTNMSYVSTIGTSIRDNLNTLAQNPNAPKILGLITGHTHFDWVDYQPTYPVIVTTCDASYHWVNGSDNLYPNNDVRVPGTINEQAFDVMHVSLDNNLWNLTRIGYGRDRIIRMTPITVSVGGTTTVTPKISAISGDSLSYSILNTAKATVSDGTITGVATGTTILKIANAVDYDNQTAWEYVQVIVTA